MSNIIILPPSENHDHPVEVKKKRILGAGAFGKVYEVYFGDDQINTYALKVIPKQDRTLKIIKNEQETIELLNKIYPNCVESILCYIDISSDDKNIYLLSEKLDHDLVDYIDLEKLDKKSLLDQAEIAYHWILKTLNGLQALHAVDIIHRDIKPENILTDKSGKIVKIADFGLSCLKKDCEGFVGSIPYVHPRVLFDENRPLEWLKIFDVYATAVMAFHILFDEILDPAMMIKLQRFQRDERDAQKNMDQKNVDQKNMDQKDVDQKGETVKRQYTYKQIEKILKKEIRKQLNNKNSFVKDAIQNASDSQASSVKKLTQLMKFMKKFLNPELTDDVSVVEAIEILS